VDISFPIVILIGWVVLNVIRGAARAGAEQARRKPPVNPEPGSLPGTNSDFLEVLRQLERARSAPHGRPKRLSAPGTEGNPAEDQPEFIEDVVSLEVDPRRPEREPVSLDAQSIEVARRRRLEAARRERPRTDKDHADFDARIRAEPDHTAVAPAPRADLARLRQAMIWNELLGPPVSMRGGQDDPTR